MTTSSNRSENIAHKKHIVFIQYYFPPMGGGGVQRIVKFLKYFDYRHFDVSILTVKPSFYYTTDPTLLAEIPAKVNVVRSGSLDPFRIFYLIEKFFRFAGLRRQQKSLESSGKIRKFAMSVFLPDSRVLWLPFALWRLLILHRKKKIDILISSVPPFTAGLIGTLAKKMLNNLFFNKRIKAHIMDFRDAWSENPYLPGTGKIRQRISGWMEQYCVKNSDGFVFVNPALQRLYRNAYPQFIDGNAIVVRNGYDETDFQLKKAVREVDVANPFRIGIMGTVYSQGNRPISLLLAVKNLLEKNPRLSEKLRIIFLGKWSPDFLTLVNSYSLGEIIEFHSYLPHRDALREAQNFHILALAIESQLPGAAAVTPGRIYEYLYLQKPILAMCPPDSDLADLIRHCQAGEVVCYQDVKAIEKILLRWMKKSHQISHPYQFCGIEKFSRKRLTEKFIKFLQKF